MPFTIPSTTDHIKTDMTINTGLNTRFINKKTNGGFYTDLPIIASNTISTTLGININPDTAQATSSMTIDQYGNLITIGTITTDTQLNVGATFTIDASTGGAITTFDSYDTSQSSSEITTLKRGVDPAFNAQTTNHLVTQRYVDKQIWAQTKRINTILGTDPGVVDSFNNLLQIITEIEGSTTATASLNSLVSKASDIETSVSDVVADAFNTVLLSCSPVIWQDQCAPLPIPSTVQSQVDGWYFKNILNLGATTNKINWYLPTNNTMRFADWLNIYLNIYIPTNNQNNNITLPILTIKTKNNTSVSYHFTLPNTNTNYYSLHIGENTPVNNFNITPIKYTNAIGQVSPTDQISSFCIETSDAAQVNTVEFVLNSFNIQQTSGTTQMLFQNSAVSTNYLYNTLFRKNIDFSPITSLNNQYYSVYNALNNSS